MKRLLFVVAGVASLAALACTDVNTDPNAVVAIRFDGSAYPSIVAQDSLRDSLGALQPLRVTPLNYRGNAVAGATVVFSSPDTLVEMRPGGIVYARTTKTDATGVRVFATVGSLQSTPDTLFLVARADSIAADSTTMTRPPGAKLVPDSITFRVRASGVAGAAATPVPYWLVSFQLRFHDRLLAPTDTTAIYTISATGPSATERAIRSFIDTTNSAGTVTRGLIINCGALAATGPDSVIVIATIRDRRPDTKPKSAQTVVRLERGTCQ